MIAGIILAGGASSRMGSPKPLLRWGGETFLDRLIGVLGVVCNPVIAVLGYQAAEVAAGMARTGEVTTVTNPNPEGGQLSSLQCGLRAVPAGCETVMFVPVDHPAVQRSTVEALARALTSGGAAIAIPRYQGRRGHPVCVRRELADELLALGPEGRASDVIHAHRAETVYIDTGDPGTVNDIDDAEAYRRLTGRLGTP